MNYERKLATVKTILNIGEIPNSDFLELAYVEGWQSVVSKGSFKKDEVVIYFEIDSLLPLIPVFDFLAKNGIVKSVDGSEGYRVKTVKLRHTLSQGIIMKVSDFKELEGLELSEGDDVTSLLGVTKYEKPIPVEMSGAVVGHFPSVFNKTDETRIQILYNKIGFLGNRSNKEWTVTEKLDGTSCTMYIDSNGKFGVCSRSYDLERNANNMYWKLAISYDVEKHLRYYHNMPAYAGYNIAINGEIVGPKIQDNLYKLEQHDFYIYNVQINERYDDDFLEDFSKVSGIKTVPYLDKVRLDRFETLDDYLKYAEGKSLINPDVNREGVVFKTKNRTSSFKVISNTFLLKNEK